MAIIGKFLPSPHSVRALDFPPLTGGLNLRDGEVSLSGGESPELVNLWWEDGALQSRPGQVRVPFHTADGAVVSRMAQGYAAAQEPFHGFTVIHSGTWLYALRAGETVTDLVCQGLKSAVPANPGTFFRFGDWLFYKNTGGFIRIAYDAGRDRLSAVSLSADAFVPTVIINASPADGHGDLYQPENRLTGKKRITYNAEALPANCAAAGDGNTRIFQLDITKDEIKKLERVTAVRVNGETVDSALYTANARFGTVTFRTAPPDKAEIVFDLAMKSPVYKLPVGGLDAVESVVVDGKTLEQGTDYRVNLVAGTVTFAEAPPVTDPPTNNTVEIVYRKENKAAYNAVMGCPYASTFGTGTQLCIVLGGCPAQPNAVFWSGNTDTGLDPSYWPMSYYNLVGDTDDPVTGFGNQYNELFVFKAHSVGKLAWGVQSVDERDSISLTYSRVNDAVGCDMPWSIQLIQNNLVFASSRGGVYRVQSSSPAYETNLALISDKINGTYYGAGRRGLLYDLRGSRTASSFDDGRRYWLCVNGNVYLWDYSLSGQENPSWFYFTGFSPVRWFSRNGETWYLTEKAAVVRLASVLTDFGEPFRKVYQFPVRNFGSYDRLKDVLTLILSTRAEDPLAASITYQTDYETRNDLTPLSHSGSRAIVPRDLTHRDLSVVPYSRVFRRRPGCRHVRHFAFRLENSTAAALSVVSAQIQYRFLGRDR